MNPDELRELARSAIQPPAVSEVEAGEVDLGSLRELLDIVEEAGELACEERDNTDQFRDGMLTALEAVRRDLELAEEADA